MVWQDCTAGQTVDLGKEFVIFGGRPVVYYKERQVVDVCQIFQVIVKPFRRWRIQRRYDDAGLFGHFSYLQG